MTCPQMQPRMCSQINQEYSLLQAQYYETVEMQLLDSEFCSYAEEEVPSSLCYDLSFFLYNLSSWVSEPFFESLGQHLDTQMK